MCTLSIGVFIDMLYDSYRLVLVLNPYSILANCYYSTFVPNVVSIWILQNEKAITNIPNMMKNHDFDILAILEKYMIAPEI